MRDDWIVTHHARDRWRERTGRSLSELVELIREGRVMTGRQIRRLARRKIRRARKVLGRAAPQTCLTPNTDPRGRYLVCDERYVFPIAEGSVLKTFLPDLIA